MSTAYDEVIEQEHDRIRQRLACPGATADPAMWDDVEPLEDISESPFVDPATGMVGMEFSSDEYDEWLAETEAAEAAEAMWEEPDYTVDGSHGRKTPEWVTDWEDWTVDAENILGDGVRAKTEDRHGVRHSTRDIPEIESSTGMMIPVVN